VATTNISLGDIHSDIQKGLINIPDHQKFRSKAGGIWPDSNSNNWISTIEKLAEDDTVTSSEKNLGHSIVTYKLKGFTDGFPKNLNDGAHRVLHSIDRHLVKISPEEKIKVSNPKKYKEQVQKYENFLDCLKKVQITEQYKIYENLKEAVDDFIVLNTAGTISSLYEVLSSKFPSCVNKWDKEPFSELLNRIDTSIAVKLISLGHDPKKVGEIHREDSTSARRNKQKFMRDNRASFLRWYLKINKTAHYDGVSSQYLTSSDKRGHLKIESDLIDFFNENGYNGSKKIIEKWEIFLNRYFAFYEQIYVKKMGNFRRNSTSSACWWISTVIYLLNNGFSKSDLKKLTETWFEKYRGTTTIIVGERKATTQLQKFNAIVYDAFGLDKSKVEKKTEKRIRNKNKLKPGFHESHINPFSTHGNGETLIENAVENLDRGPRKMTEEEIDSNRACQNVVYK
jgi:hypothetical protein